MFMGEEARGAGGVTTLQRQGTAPLDNSLQLFNLLISNEKFILIYILKYIVM